jgi:phosphoribosylamine--glycine ligase
MGAYSPCPFIDETEMSEIVSKTVTPLIRGLAAEKLAYQGLLYAGLMLTSDGPKFLEYNVRFGDPETEAVLPRLKSDLLPVLLECARGELKTTALEWDKRHSVTVVMASQGYPGAFDKGFAVTGLDEAEKTGAVVFHSGTALKDGCVVTSGGRVFAVTALGNGLKEAAEGAYRALGLVHFRNSYYRTDIAKRIYERSVTV